MKLNIFDVIFTICLVVIVLLASVACGDEVTQRPAVVMFTFEYCGPCRSAKAILESQQRDLERRGIAVIYYDVHDRPEKVKQYKITETPTFLGINSAGSVVFRTDNVHDAIQKAGMLR
jgi:thiol-disulfide isomerase/thioredoxin